MERLTRSYTNKNGCILHERANNQIKNQQLIDKLAEYEQAEEDGLLVKVIRCKDCKYFSGGGLWSKGHWCGRTARPGDCVHVTENDFCSMAEQALAKMKGV